MASSGKEIVLITGANTGLGLEIVRKLLSEHADRFYCLIGCRTLSKGQSAVKELHDQNLTGCEVIQIEVTNDESIAEAAKKVQERFGKLDVLHVNAGIAADKDMLPAHEPMSSIIMETMKTNVAGAAQTVETFIPLLSKADNPRIVFMSSGLGSLHLHSQPGFNNKWPVYSASKAALNMIMQYYWQRFSDWKINSCCPGFRATALNNFGAAESNVTPGKLEDGAINAARLTLLAKDGEAGTNTRRNDETGEIERMPW